MGHSAGLRGGDGSTFSRERCICPTLLMTRERLLYVDHVKYVWSETIRGLSVGCLWCVGRVSPTGCTSIRIVATLG
jgi:hypothetical protein